MNRHQSHPTSVIIMNEDRSRAYYNLFRGPFIVAAVCVSLLLPYLSHKVLIQIGIASCGFLFFFYDLYVCFENEFRIFVSNLLDRLVLDDLLKTIYDPEAGIIAMMIAAVLGTSSMYALRLNDDQKTRLIQSSLCISNDKARSLLLTPGGCREFLPEGMKAWLNQTISIKTVDQNVFVKTIDQNITVETIEFDSEEEDEDSDSSPPTYGNAFADDGGLFLNDNFRDNATPFFCDERHSQEMPHAKEDSTSKDQSDTEFSIGTNEQLRDPASEMFSILKTIAYGQIRSYIKYIPDAFLENAGVSAIMALGLQMAVRRNSRRSTLGSMSTILLSGVAAGSISTVMAKEMILQQDSFQKVARSVLLRSWKRLKATAYTNGSWKSTLAMIVLVVFGRKR